MPRIALHILFLLISSSLLAQTKVGGKVVDQNGDGIPFASILFKGTASGTVSDEHGKFYLESSKDLKLIQVSFVGYETEEVLVQNQKLLIKYVVILIQYFN